MIIFKPLLFVIFLNSLLFSAPTADAGPNQDAVISDSTLLDGSGSSNDVEEYLWEITDAPSNHDASFDDATLKKPTLTTSKDGKYTIKLTVKSNDMFNNTDTDEVDIIFTSLNYKYDYKCDLFYKSLTSYTHITSNADNDKVNGVTSISYPADELEGDILCEKDGDSDNCNRVAPPLNKYAPILYSSSKLGTNEGLPSNPLTNLEYGNFSGNFDLTLEPENSYDNNSRKVMLLGDVSLKKANTLSLKSGDYFFNSLHFEKENASIILADNGEVRIFIKENFTAEKSGLNINVDGDTSKLFIYTGGNLELSHNNLSVFQGFFYTKGDTTFNSSIELHGAITSEGTITIEEDSTIYQDSNASDLGYGECSICYIEDDGDDGTILTPYINIHDTVNQLIITEDPSEDANSNQNDDEDLDILDQNDVDVGNGDEDSAGKYIYNFGDNYSYSGDSRESYYKTSRNTEDIEGNMFGGAQENEQNVVRSASWAEGNSKEYNVYLSACRTGSGGGDDIAYIAGAFDAWNTIDSDDDNPPESVDRNISTKILGKEFSLSLASVENVDDDDDKYVDKTNSDCEEETGKVEVAIYKNGTNNIISNVVDFQIPDNENCDNDIGEQHTDANFIVTSAERNATLVMKVCATYRVKSAEEVYQDAIDDGQSMPAAFLAAMAQQAAIMAGTAEKIFTIYPLNDCDEDKMYSCDEETEDDPVFHMCGSTDQLSIRPKEFLLGNITNYVTSAQGQLFDAEAKDEDGNLVDDYTISSNDYELNSTKIIYMPDGTPSDTLKGKTSVSTFSFSKGISEDINISFNDVGKVKVILIDENWTIIDKDDGSLETCDGRFICGESSIIEFIPSHFSLSDISIHNHENNNFTYLANDKTMPLMAARLGLTITAKNVLNETTQNFDVDSWNNNISVFFTGDNDANESNITNTSLDFDNGTCVVPWDETNNTQALMFNFTRDVNNPVNPFKVDDDTDGFDFNFSIQSVYEDGDKHATIVDDNGADINATGDAIFIYGRTNASRTIFRKGDTYQIPIFYEAYCSGHDCNKSLLPGGTDSNSTNDPRWYINNKHNNTKTGTISDANETRNRTIVTLDTIDNTTEIDKSMITLNLDDNVKLPYKTTIQNDANSWLIYNKYNINATTNTFDVEFLNTTDSASWAGTVEEDVGNTQIVGAARTNRRSMW